MEGQLGEKSSRAHCENMENIPLHCIAGKCNVDSIRKTAVNRCGSRDCGVLWRSVSRAGRKKCLTRHRPHATIPMGDTPSPQTGKGRQAGKEHTMKKVNTGNDHRDNRAPITADNLMQAARAAAYVTVRRAYLSTPRSLRDASGEVRGYDGATTGGTDMIRRVYQGFGQGLHAAQGRADRAADAMDAATTDYATALADLVDAMDGYTDATATDADDLIQTAALALWQSIALDSPDGQTAPEGAFLDACSAVNKAIYAERSNTGTLVRVKQDAAGNVLRSDEYKYTRLPHLYVDHLETDDNGEPTADIVDVSDALAAYQRGQGMRDDIQTALAALEAKDRQVLVWHAQGATYETIARRMRTTVPAIKMRVKRAREKARAALEKSI